MISAELTRYSMSTLDVARALGYNVQYVRWMAQNGKLPALKRIHKWIFDPKEIEQWLRDKTTEATMR